MYVIILEGFGHTHHSLNLNDSKPVRVSHLQWRVQLSFLWSLVSYFLIPLNNCTYVLIMQYGAVDIDSSLVAAKRQGDEDILMLNNGCLCCTVRGDLVRMLGELLTTKKDKFDHIVIETTGVQTPSTWCQTCFEPNFMIGNLIYLRTLQSCGWVF